MIFKKDVASQLVLPEDVKITTENLFKSLSPEQKKDLLLNNPNIQGPGGKQVYDPLTNTIRIEDKEEGKSN